VIVFTSPFNYMRLIDERGARLFWRDLLPVVLLALVLTAPFLFFPNVNFSRPSGFVDRMGSLASVLAGFYIAALVAVATFAASLGDIDEKITNGKIYLGSLGGDELSRREYVCAIFGFLSFLALFLSVVSSFAMIVAPPFKGLFAHQSFQVSGIVFDLGAIIRGGAVFVYSVIVSAMIVTTFYGLYYLTDRIYAKKPKVLPKEKD
jgi:hypothetical protein